MGNQMNEQQEHSLRVQIEKGWAAQRAYDAYLKDFFVEREAMLYDSFKNSAFDEATLLELKRRQMSLSDLQGQTLSDIAFGKEAERKLTLP
jgi:hypothetical protein